MINKKIAVTQRLMLNESYYELREGLDVQWGNLFKELNYIPIVLPLEYDFENYFDIIGLDGILLTGGNDLNSLNPSDSSALRDSFEKKLIDYAIKNDIPLFGICRGMQIIAEYFGSSFERVENQVAIRHNIKVNEISKYSEILKNLDQVNSYHNYAVKDVPNDLLISATDENGTIKAIEHKDYKVFAQMWHTERESPFKDKELKLIKRFYASDR